jgi:threonine dehydrogenase-like Zn-dependent dehydrogenase
MAQATRGSGLDVAFDFAGYAPARTQALDSLGFDGRLLLVGISGGPISVQNDSSYQYMRKQILGHYGSGEQHIRQLVRLVELGRLDFTRSVTATYPLAAAAEAVERLESKEGNPIRLVLVP